MSIQPSAPSINPPTLSGILRALLGADLTVQLRNGRALLLTFFPPLAVFYGLSTAKRSAQLGGPIVNVALALTLGIALIAILGYTASVARDRELGVFQRLRVTPAPTWTIMVSRLAVQILSMLAMSVVVLVAAAVVGNERLDPPAYLLTLAMVIFISAVFLGVGQAFVGLIKSVDTVNAVGRLSFLPLVALGLFAHSTIFGTTFETIARWSPGGAVATLLAWAPSPPATGADTRWGTPSRARYTNGFARNCIPGG